MDTLGEDAFLSLFFNFDGLGAESAASHPDNDIPPGVEESCTLSQLQPQSNLLEMDFEMQLDEFAAFECDPTTHGLVPTCFAIPPTSPQQEQDLAYSIHAVHDAQTLDGPSLHQITQLGLPVDQALPELFLVADNDVRILGLALNQASV